MTPLLGLDNLLEGLTELRERRLLVVIKDIIKDTDEQPGEEIHRVRTRRVLITGASGLVELGLCHPLTKRTCSSTRKLLERCSLGVFFEASSLLWFPAPFPSPVIGEWGRKLQTSNYGLVFLFTCPHPGAHPEVPH